MDSKKIFAIAAVAIIVVASVAAVVVVNNNNNDQTSDKLEDVSIAYLNLGYYPFMIGFQNGWFDNLGFKVTHVVVTGSGNVAVEALTSGAATMAATGDGPFVNAVGKYGDKMVGLCQYTQSEGSLAGHMWFVKTSVMDGKIDKLQTDEKGIATNSQTVANQIKEISNTKTGQGHDGMFSVVVNKGSTTHNNFMKWCLQYGLTYTSSPTETADVYINEMTNATVDMLKGALDSGCNAVACNKNLYSTIEASCKEGEIYKIGDSSPLNEASYSVLCTTQANYEKYSTQMMKVLEVLKKINEWMEQNVDEAAKICSELGGGTVDAIKKSINGTEHKVVWETSKLTGWVNTAKINGYTVTEKQFTECCPHRNIINGWYQS